MYIKPTVLAVNVLFLFYVSVESQNFDFKVITSVRHGIDLALDYIEKNLYRTNVDGLLGVAFVRGLMKSAFQNGTNIMDNTSLRFLERADQIIEKSKFVFENDLNNGNNWKFRYLVDDDIWSKNVKYKKNKLRPFWKTENPFFLENIMERESTNSPNSDVCLREIVNDTEKPQQFSTPCIVTTDCWNRYFKNANGHGYHLTHKLLFLQIAKARKCLIDRKFYDVQVKDICSSVMSEAFSANTYGKLEVVFDLFLEQVLLCGYEGFTEFLQNNWLYFILKSQRPTGCFSDVLSDYLKSRIKKDMTQFEDGCNDHTTGLGVGVLALHYHYIVKEISM